MVPPGCPGPMVSRWVAPCMVALFTFAAMTAIPFGSQASDEPVAVAAETSSELDRETFTTHRLTFEQEGRGWQSFRVILDEDLWGPDPYGDGGFYGEYGFWIDMDLEPDAEPFIQVALWDNGTSDPDVDIRPFAFDHRQEEFGHGGGYLCSGDCMDHPPFEIAWIFGASHGNVTFHLGMIEGMTGDDIRDRPLFSVEPDANGSDGWAGNARRHMADDQTVHEWTFGQITITESPPAPDDLGLHQNARFAVEGEGTSPDPGTMTIRMWAERPVGVHEWSLRYGHPGGASELSGVAVAPYPLVNNPYKVVQTLGPAGPYSMDFEETFTGSEKEFATEDTWTDLDWGFFSGDLSTIYGWPSAEGHKGHGIPTLGPGDPPGTLPCTLEGQTGPCTTWFHDLGDGEPTVQQKNVL